MVAEALENDSFWLKIHFFTIITHKPAYIFPKTFCGGGKKISKNDDIICEWSQGVIPFCALVVLNLGIYKAMKNRPVQQRRRSMVTQGVLRSSSIANPEKVASMIKKYVNQVRPIPFYDFVLYVVLSLFTGSSPNMGRISSACFGRTPREKREDNK